MYLYSSPGIYMGIAGAFCDDADKPPIILPLGGFVALQFDYLGRNFRETFHTLWALHQAIQLIDLAK